MCSCRETATAGSWGEVVAPVNRSFKVPVQLDTMSFASRTTAVVVSTLVVPLALVLFASGFFPYKPFLPGLATFNGDENVSRQPPVFDRVIFMVIDALRRYCSQPLQWQLAAADQEIVISYIPITLDSILLKS